MFPLWVSHAVGIISIQFFLGLLIGMVRTALLLDMFRKESNLPSVRRKYDVGWLPIAPNTFFLRDAVKYKDQLIEKLAETLESAKLPNVHIVIGKVELDENMHQAVFVDRLFLATFTIALTQYGSKDLRLSWWKSERPRKYIEVANYFYGNFWYYYGIFTLGLFLPLALGIKFGYKLVVGRVNLYKDYKLAFEKVPQFEIESLEMSIDVAVKEVLDDIGIGADALERRQ